MLQNGRFITLTVSELLRERGGGGGGGKNNPPPQNLPSTQPLTATP